MLIVFGQKNYGKVDQVPGLFHVVTEFFHLYYVPVIPLKSYLMLDGDGAAVHRAPIKLNLKSILMAWLRALFVAAFVIGLLVGCGLTLQLADHKQAIPVEALAIPW